MGIVCSLIGGVVWGCSTVPLERPTLRTVGAMTATEPASRRLAFERRHGGCIDVPEARRIERIADELSGPNWNGPRIRVGVLASEQSNAFVLPSGYVYLTSGMVELICTDDELAAVVAHELSHLDDLSAFNSLGLGLDEKLTVEVEADERAIALLVKTQYDPSALMLMIAKLADDQPAGWAEHRCSRLAACLGNGVDGGVDGESLAPNHNTMASLTPGSNSSVRSSGF